MQKVKLTRRSGPPTFTVSVSVPEYVIFYDTAEAHWHARQEWKTLQDRI